MAKQAVSTLAGAAVETTAFSILAALSISHMLNDTMQSLMPALYPMLKGELQLSFGQVGLIQLAFQLTASLLQPIVGTVTDKRPMPYSLAAGMGFTLIGLVLLSQASSFPAVLVAAATVGLGSSVFHPEASRMARIASGGRHGFAQSLFQVGGNAGSALGPLLAAYIVTPYGQHSVAWFSVIAMLGMIILGSVGRWYVQTRAARSRRAKSPATRIDLTRREVGIAMTVLIALMFSKFFYLASMGTYYTFYLIHEFDVSVQMAQIYLFVFLGSTAVGTFFGGPIGDRFGRKWVIWGSIVGVLPFTLILPHVGLAMTVALSIPIGLVLSSAFSAIVVYAQELVPGRVGLISGMFFGFAFGMGGLGAAVLGELADHTSVRFVFDLCAFLPAIGFLTALLPNLERPRVATGV